MTSALRGCALDSSASIDWMAMEEGIRESANAALVTHLIRDIFADYCSGSKSLPVSRLSLGISSGYLAPKVAGRNRPEGGFPGAVSSWWGLPGFPPGCPRGNRNGRGA